MIKRKLALILAGIALVLTACGQGGNNTNNANGTTNNSDKNSNATSTSPVTLKVLVASDWLKDRNWQLLFDDFEKQTGNKIDLQSAPVLNYPDLVNTRLATESGPDLLFYWSQPGKLKQLQPEKNLLELTNEEFISRINPTVTKFFFKNDGKLYGVPTSGINVSGIIYNKKVFSDLGIQIPKTYDEFLAACEKIKAAGITPVYEAAKDGWPLQIFSFAAMANVINKKPDLMDKINSHQSTFDQESGLIDALKKQNDLLKKGYLNKDLFSGTYDMSLEQVAKGKSAMVFQVDAAIPSMLQKYPDAQIGMFPMPWDGNNFVAVSDPLGVYVLKNSKHVDVAKKFIEFVSSKEELTKYFNTVKAIPTWTGVKVALNPGTDEMNPFVESGKAMPFFNSLSAVDIESYIPLLQQMYGGTMTPADVTKALQSNFEKNAKAAGQPGF